MKVLLISFFPLLHKAEVEVRLKERETALAAKIGKLQPR